MNGEKNNIINSKIYPQASSNSNNILESNINKGFVFQEKVLSYSEIQEIIKSKKLELIDKEKYYNIEEFQELVKEST